MLTEYAQANMALGSEIIFTITADSQPEQTCTNFFALLWRTTYVFERQFSRFLPNSELSTFNRKAGLKVPVSPEFLHILHTAKKLSIKTAGHYNPFILPALQRAGYDKSFVAGHQSDLQDDHSQKQVVEISKLELGKDWARIPYGTALDLGGCGKGYLADILADMASEQAWITGFWFSLGGDVVGEGFDANNKPWNVQIYSTNDEPRYFTTTGDRFAAATSSTLVHKGRGWHHIIDPTTQDPAVSDISLVSVLMKSCVEADVLASCAIIVGSEKSVPFLTKNGVKAAAISGKDGSGANFERDFGQALCKKVAHHA